MILFKTMYSNFENPSNIENQNEDKNYAHYKSC